MKIIHQGWLFNTLMKVEFLIYFRLCLTVDLSWSIRPFFTKYGRSEKKKRVGIASQRKEDKQEEKKAGFISKLSAKYPFLPFVLGGVLLTVLIVDLVNYYK